MELLGHVTRSIYFFKIVRIELITSSEYSVWNLKTKHGGVRQQKLKVTTLCNPASEHLGYDMV